MKFSISDFFSKCDQIRSLLRIWQHLLKKSLMENFIFVLYTDVTASNDHKNLFHFPNKKLLLRERPSYLRKGSSFSLTIICVSNDKYSQQ